MWQIFRKLLICIVGVTILLSGGVIVSRISEKRQEEELKKCVDDNYVKYYQILVDYTNRINNDDKAVYDELIKGIDNDELLSKATFKNALSYYYLTQNNYKEYSELAKESISDYKKTVYATSLELQTYSYMINNEIANNKYDKALEYCYEAMEILDSDKSKYIKEDFKEKFRVIINCNFINIFIHNDLPNQAKKYYEKISDYKEGEYIYEDNKQFIIFSKLIYNDSVENYNEALKLTLEYHNMAKDNGSKNLDGLRINIGKALIKVGRADEALEHILAAEKFYIENQKEISLANVYIVYGEYFEAMEEYKSAIEYYIKAYEIYEEEKELDKQKDSVTYINRVHKKSGLNIDISKYLEGYIEISENNNTETGIADLFHIIEGINEKSYQSTLLAREQENEAIERASNNRIILIILLLSSIILLIVILFTLKKEIRSKKLYEKELKDIINKDFLTKCYSRSYGIGRVDDLINKNKEFSIALIDIDNFKNINDTYGHLVGDEALRLIGRILNEKYNNLITPSRYGGEEFLIILECNKEEALRILEEIRVDIEKSTFNNDLTLTISGGLIESKESTVEKNIELVDMLLYDAKTKGKNRISVK